uniref:G-RICH n=1 Tax=Carassius auratus TaxID=7957 RepID=UPI0000F51D5C|nr:Chain A, G-RICH [Carassius auratus]
GSHMELPLFFGWFLLPEEEERIKCATMDFLKTLDTLEAFKEHISEFTGEAEKEVDLEQYFQNPLQLHCTTKFCDYGKAEGAKEYAELQVVKESLTKSYELSVTALIVTPRTFGARVALTEAQVKLWPEGADKEGVAPALLPSVEALPAGSRAHVTLGCSAGVETVQTGLDLLEILALQKEGKEGTQVEMDLGTLTYLSEGRWFLALREPINADTTFTSFSED